MVKSRLSTNAALVLNAGLALAGYVSGALVGRASAGTPSQPMWPIQVTRTLRWNSAC